MDSYSIGHTSIEDFDLKLCRVLKFSKPREEVLKLPKSSWLDTKSVQSLLSQTLSQTGEPFELKPKAQPQSKNQADKWQSYNPTKKAVLLIATIFGAYNPKSQYQKQTTTAI